MDQRSMFSLNTYMTTQQEDQTHNEFHEYYYRLLGEVGQEYPTLSKIIFLQLVLRENLIIYTENRVDVRDVWLTIARKLQIKKPNIYVVDAETNIEEILSTKTEYQRTMLYDIHKISNSALNKLLNTVDTSVSFLAIQNPHEKLSPHITDLFSMSFLYSQQDQVDQISFQAKNQNQEVFEKHKFNEWVKFNFQIAVQQSEEEAFLKPLMAQLKENLKKENIQVSQFRWKKMIKVLKFLATTRQQTAFKKLTLSEIVFVPNLLAFSYEAFVLLQKIINKIMVEFIPIVGIQKFFKSIKNHFWFTDAVKKSLLTEIQSKKNSISFFYPCSKYSEVVSITTSEERASYNVKGYDKKLMSDHHYEIQAEKRYKLTLEIRSVHKMIIHIGIACYDKHKNIIHPIQICRKKQSSVTFKRIDGNKIYVTNEQNLANWNKVDDFSAFQKCIGVYPSGEIDELIPIDYIIQNEKQPYSQQKQKAAYTSIQNDCIQLSTQAQQWFVNFKHLLKKDKTILMNHYAGGTYCIGKTIENENISDWTKVQMEYSGIQFENTGSTFFPESSLIRVVLMVNYSSGYPDYKIKDKEGELQFRGVQWGLVE